MTVKFYIICMTVKFKVYLCALLVTKPAGLGHPLLFDIQCRSYFSTVCAGT